MKILDDLISILDVEASIKDIRQGIFHTGVMTRYCGLAATLPKDALRQEPPYVKEPGFLMDKSASELVRFAYSESILEAAIGMAAINSLLEVDEQFCIELNAAEIIMEKGKGKRVAIVGHFPFVQRVRDIADMLWVIEKNPREGDFSENDGDSLIPQADIVAITGTSLTNHSFEHLINLCHPNAFIVLLGDTTPLSSIFFDYGVDAVSGTRVINPDLALRCVSEGANFRQIKGTRRLTMLK